MSNCLGRSLRLTTAGESHGPGLTAIIDGCPAGLDLSVEELQAALEERRPGVGRYVSQRQESDRIEMRSGVFQGKATGMPIVLWIANQDAKPQHYSHLEQVFRPGHADYTYQAKYGIRDHRGGGRASARETALWVAAGVIAEKILRLSHDIKVRSAVVQVGEITAPSIQWAEVDREHLYLADPAMWLPVTRLIDALRREGDSIGAKIAVEALGVPAGWGDPVFAKLSAGLAHAMMSIPAVKAVEIGDGCAVATQRGSEHRDELCASGFLSNHAGGMLGGISTGQTIQMTLSIKPASSIRIPARTLSVQGGETAVVTKGRHDPCVAFRAVPVAKAMMFFVLADCYLCQLKQTLHQRGERDE